MKIKYDVVIVFRKKMKMEQTKLRSLLMRTKDLLKESGPKRKLSKNFWKKS